MPIIWVGVEAVPILFANQMVIQHSAENEFVLTFGQLTPPVILGTPDQQRKQTEALDYVAVKPVSRVSFNRQRLTELIKVLQENLATHDRRFEGE